MEIIISNSDGKPIYEQIAEQIRFRILDGTLHRGDSIPPMRKLAKSLHVSVITVQRAYEELRQEGMIETTVGRGTFVAAEYTVEFQTQIKEFIDSHLGAAVTMAKHVGIPLEELTTSLELQYNHEEGDICDQICEKLTGKSRF